MVQYTGLFGNLKEHTLGTHDIILRIHCAPWIGSHYCMCVVHYTCLFGALREDAIDAHDITNAVHYEKSLCSDNDRPMFWTKSVIL